ncbi:hypothetical protein F0U44_16670 [Nocardioides humilatus]|uniref:Uncharacterized protein n=1 Tax=Nocardioides humilatus TaxID=2607660 RepID=A0A5B1L7X1_9ACTN|nr:hypothetical protein [Nocardioides humilatus]KAA1416821.1 hypothetical protein F0U44_16670 [Nocardioides humilatus]
MSPSPEVVGTAPLLVVPGRPVGTPSYRRELGQTAWVVVVSGLVAGVAIGLLLRAAMLVLRLASPASTGLTSDDGFEIGRFTLFGVYNLVMLGVALGVVGAAAYIAVLPFLVGRPWVQRLTVAVTAMLLGGSGVINDHGRDFRDLDTEVAVALFLVLPFVVGLLVPAVVEHVGRHAETGPPWLPVLVLAFPLAALAGAFQLVVIAVLLPVRRAFLDKILASPALLWLFRLLFAAIPVLAVPALVADLRAVL